MNFIFVSPHFPKTYYRFCKELKNNGVNVLGIASDEYNNLSNELKESLTEYYKVNDMNNYYEMFKAVAYFSFKYGKIDFIESNNEYWLEQDAKLRTDFNVTTGKKDHEINFFKSKEAMKKDYHKAGIKVARYHIPTTLSEGKKLVKEVGYPIVAKPDNGVGAYHTYKITNEKELIEFYDNKPEIKYIMEEFINGNLISFDGVVDGNYNPVFYSNEVFPNPIMDVVNKNLDCFYIAAFPYRRCIVGIIHQLLIVECHAAKGFINIMYRLCLYIFSVLSEFPLGKICIYIEAYWLQFNGTGTIVERSLFGAEHL